MTDTIIFSDLDGTLLDAADYSFAPAAPALALIHARGIPLVLCSSKTRAEIEVLRRHLDNAHPFIAENGGGIFVPRRYFPGEFEAEAFGNYRLVRLGMPYAEIRKRLVRLRERHGAKVRGFADMTDDEVAALTGLSRDAAQLAKQRDFDEAFVFDGAPDESFLRAIEADGLHWTQGQFFHVMGDHDKGRAVKLLASLYRGHFGPLTSIGLGDSLNDLPLLQAVDRPVLVQHANGSFDSRIDLPGLLKTQHPGPSGWNDAVLRLLAAPAAADAARRQLVDIFEAALAAADPYRAVLDAVRVEHGCLRVAGAEYDLADHERIIVVGAGKAAARMALAVEELLGERISGGLVIVKHGHQAPLRCIEQVESSHPVPGEAGAAATLRVLDMLRAAGDRTLVLCLLSGGASALLVAPVAGVTLQDKQQVTGLLLGAGAAIGELNAVRKHLSAVKGGRLARACTAPLLTLLLSDVIGDRLDVIASGPTAPDGSTFAEAWAVIEKYRLQERIPPRARDYLKRGAAGQEAETVKSGDPCLARTRNAIVAGNGVALAAAARKARQLDLAANIVSAELQGEARSAARQLAQTARATLAGMSAGEQRRCLLYGGETTVTVRGKGKGGRNQELALAFALEIEGTAGIALLSAGTDGTDGPTDAAGAVVDGDTAALARRHGIEPAGYLGDNDSYTFFQCFDHQSGGHSHLKTGPTGTNVMDIQIVLCEREAA